MASRTSNDKYSCILYVDGCEKITENGVEYEAPCRKKVSFVWDAKLSDIYPHILRRIPCGNARRISSLHYRSVMRRNLDGVFLSFVAAL